MLSTHPFPDVSRETAERLTLYAALLRKWQAAINLVSPATLAAAEERHFQDSMQLYPLLPKSPIRLVDLGSGAGFPGLVLAIMGAPDVHLVESDGRKCAFLREVARATETPVTIHARRIEEIPGLGAAVVTARALAPLSALLEMAVPHLAAGGTALFLKGQQANNEIENAYAAGWAFALEKFPSATEPAAAILRLSDIERKTS
jgi:16S rRNA (guanine527-N7)-methyltransferase